MEEDEQNLPEQTNNRPWLYKKGQSGNPKGRPKGSKSMKQWAREMLEKMDEDQRQEFVAGLSKDIIWKMAEGNPLNNVEANVKAELNISIDPIIAKKNAITPRTAKNSD